MTRMPWQWETGGVHLDQRRYDDWVNDLLLNVGDSWDDDSSAEDIISRYLHEMERRLDAANISRDQYVGDDDQDEAGAMVIVTEPTIDPFVSIPIPPRRAPLIWGNDGDGNSGMDHD